MILRMGLSRYVADAIRPLPEGSGDTWAGSRFPDAALQAIWRQQPSDLYGIDLNDGIVTEEKP